MREREKRNKNEEKCTIKMIEKIDQIEVYKKKGME